MQSTTWPEATAVKALAHPVRMRLLGMLRMDGPATATQLAQRLDLNSGATSYHLRQLEQHGFIAEDTERGNHRERWWRSVHKNTSVSAGTTDAERDASDAFAHAAAIQHTDDLHRAVAERTELPDAWRHVSVSSDYLLRVTVEQAVEIRDRMHALLAQFATEHPYDAEDASPEARHYIVQFHGFPRPGQIEPVEPTDRAPESA